MPLYNGIGRNLPGRQVGYLHNLFIAVEYGI